MRSHVRRHLLVAFVVLVTTSPALGDERSTARRFDDARRDEPSLTAFLKTMLYRRAGWNVSYRELKELVRNSLEYSFLAGESLFEGRDYRRVRPAYRALARGWVPAAADARALAASDKAAVQARLERAFLDFER